jgi:hypothetical protein
MVAAGACTVIAYGTQAPALPVVLSCTFVYHLQEPNLFASHLWYNVGVEIVGSMSGVATVACKRVLDIALRPGHLPADTHKAIWMPTQYILGASTH